MIIHAIYSMFWVKGTSVRVFTRFPYIEREQMQFAETCVRHLESCRARMCKPAKEENFVRSV